jgi:inosine-uridine nucleoside N-ribohydrolase
MKMLSMLFKLFFIIILCWQAAAYSAESHSIIIDTDVGFDDVIAMLYLFERHDFQVKAITVESIGANYCPAAYHNVSGILSLAHYKNIPIACGHATLTPTQQHSMARIIQRFLTLYGAGHLLPPTKNAFADNPAALLAKIITAEPHPITLLAIGPLTNIAEALEQYPQIKKNIRAIVIMGGAINVPGNLSNVYPGTSNHTAEWNIYLNAPAAKKVFTSGIPLRLVPLDVTQTLPIDWDFYQQLKNSHPTPEAAFIYELLTRNQQIIHDKKWYFWDPLAAVLLTDPNLAEWKTELLDVQQQPEFSKGTLVVNNRTGNPVAVCTRVDAKKFKTLLLKTINYNH